MKRLLGVFLMLVVMNLVAGFQTLGTLMAVGLMMLPAVSARLWHDTLPSQLLNASLQAGLSGYAGPIDRGKHGLSNDRLCYQPYYFYFSNYHYSLSNSPGHHRVKPNSDS